MSGDSAQYPWPGSCGAEPTLHLAPGHSSEAVSDNFIELVRVVGIEPTLP